MSKITFHVPHVNESYPAYMAGSICALRTRLHPPPVGKTALAEIRLEEYRVLFSMYRALSKYAGLFSKYAGLFSEYQGSSQHIQGSSQNVQSSFQNIQGSFQNIHTWIGASFR